MNEKALICFDYRWTDRPTDIAASGVAYTRQRRQERQERTERKGVLPVMTTNAIPPMNRDCSVNRHL